MYVITPHVVTVKQTLSNATVAIINIQKTAIKYYHLESACVLIASLLQVQKRYALNTSKVQ